MKKSKRITKESKSKKSSKTDGTFFELDGKVSLFTRKNGKIVEREEIDGTVVLECLMVMLAKSLEYYEDEVKHDKVIKSAKCSECADCTSESSCGN